MAENGKKWIDFKAQDDLILSNKQAMPKDNFYHVTQRKVHILKQGRGKYLINVDKITIFSTDRLAF